MKKTANRDPKYQNGMAVAFDDAGKATIVETQSNNSDFIDDMVVAATPMMYAAAVDHKNAIEHFEEVQAELNDRAVIASTKDDKKACGHDRDERYITPVKVDNIYTNPEKYMSESILYIMLNEERAIKPYTKLFILNSQYRLADEYLEYIKAKEHPDKEKIMSIYKDMLQKNGKDSSSYQSALQSRIDSLKASDVAKDFKKRQDMFKTIEQELDAMDFSLSPAEIEQMADARVDAELAEIATKELDDVVDKKAMEEAEEFYLRVLKNKTLPDEVKEYPKQFAIKITGKETYDQLLKIMEQFPKDKGK